MMVWCSGFHNLYAKILSGMNINQYRTISEFNIEKTLETTGFIFSISRANFAGARRSLDITKYRYETCEYASRTQKKP
ncbi:hypothetical protein EYC84_006937 [Monilinia fructicola]|uniref:Uncharacterized protein n=1 Tax=Monilinia fructicola TaxID=38448 RepID=A0A5M9K7P2_MONFR|nr:hypothetical protein EYC84_006937 [Monilinia fructicola]